MRYVCPECGHIGSNGIGEKYSKIAPLCDKCNFNVSMIPHGLVYPASKYDPMPLLKQVKDIVIDELKGQCLLEKNMERILNKLEKINLE